MIRRRFILGGIAAALSSSVLWGVWHVVWLGLDAGVILQFWYVFAVFLALCLAPFWIVLDRWICRPLLYIDRANMEVAQGKLEAAMIPSSRIPGGEIGGFMRSRNAMLGSLLSRQRQLEKREDALRESEEQYRSLTLNIPGMVYRGGSDWSTEIVSHSEGICGYPVDEFNTRKVNWLDLIHPDDRQRVFEEGSLLLEKPASIVQEYRILDRDGSVWWVSDHKTSFFKADGSVLGVDGIVYDVTEQKRAEEALREREEQLRARTHELGERVKELNSLYGIGRLIEQVDASIECTLREAVDLIPPAWQYPDATCARIVFEGQAFQTDAFSETAWKQSADIKVRGEKVGAVEVCYLGEAPDPDAGPFLKGEGDLLAAIAGRLGRVAERMRTEEALRESEEKFRAISASARDAILMMDNEGKISYWNDSATGIFGYSPGEALGEELHRLIAPERYRDAFYRGFEGFKATGEGAAIGQALELTALKRDGAEFPIELSLSAVRLQGKWHAVGIVRDITDRKRAEEHLREAQRAQVLIQTAGAAAHEINQPLGVIIGMAQILLNTMPSDDSLRPDIEEMHRAGQRINEIVRKMMAVDQYTTRAYVGKAEIVDFEAASKARIDPDNGAG